MHMCVFLCICMCVCVCIYILLFKLLPIFICLITSSWSHLPSFSMIWLPYIPEVRAKVSDLGSTFWQKYVQVILSASLNISAGIHDVRCPIIRY